MDTTKLVKVLTSTEKILKRVMMRIAKAIYMGGTMTWMEK